MYKKSLISSNLLIHFIAQNILCDNRTYVNLECFETTRISLLQDHEHPRLEFVSSSLVVENSKTILEKVVYPNESSVVNTHDIWQLRIETGKKSVKFVPVGIKRKFPKLASI